MQILKKFVNCFTALTFVGVVRDILSNNSTRNDRRKVVLVTFAQFLNNQLEILVEFMHTIFRNCTA